MAKRTNKTDHVLNLLSQGKKSGSAAPPVQLKKAESEEPLPESAEAAAAEQDGQGGERSEELQKAATEKTSPQEAQTVSAADAEDIPASAASAEPSVAEQKEVPQVSVVHTSSEENPIAESVKDALEAELEDYLKENPSLPDLPQEMNRTEKEDLPDLPDLPKQTDAEKTEELPDLPDIPETVDQLEQSEEQADPRITETTAPAETPAAPEPVREKVENKPEPPAVAEETAVSEPQADQTGIVEEASISAVAQTVSQEAQNPSVSAPSESKTEIQPEEKATAQTAETPVRESQAATPEAVSEPEKAAEKEDEPDFATVNVMEYLVREQAPKYIRQFGHCDCSRCLEDTIALSLTHLPAKYVVVNKNAVSPLLNFYEKRFAGQLIVEITKASMTVDEFPHH
ncbi:hypothetical protein D3Z38_12325 [Clostridiales bacterium]|nr:hypothetical protein [Clostridiales bacterium]